MLIEENDSIVYQDTMVWKLNRSDCVLFLSEFMFKPAKASRVKA
jgi:hypothetical protein